MNFSVSRTTSHSVMTINLREYGEELRRTGAKIYVEKVALYEEAMFKSRSTVD